MRIYIPLILICFIQSLNAQTTISKKELEDIYNKVEQVIGDDWFIHPQPSGFDIYFCRSCRQEFDRWKHSGDAIYFSEGVMTPFATRIVINSFRRKKLIRWPIMQQ